MNAISEIKLKGWDEAIRRGNAGAVRAELKKLKDQRVSREMILPVAALCRRADFLPFALHLLQPLVRPTRKVAVPATLTERAEYAACLVRVGAGDEALELLKTLSSARTPEVLLYQAFAMASQWDYGAAIPVLKKYVASHRITEYWRLIGQLNLAAALVWERPGQVPKPWLSQIIKTAKLGGIHFVLGNALELCAQNAILSGAWKDAEHWLSRASEALEKSGGREEFFVRKWRAIARCRREGMKTGVARELNTVRREARERGHWETLRQCEFFEAEAKRDEHLFARLYFGTPYPAFRARVLQLWKPKRLPESYRWCLGPRGKVAGVWDLRTGGGKFKPGSLMHRLALALASDFFRPLRLETLHFRLYPDEHYNLISSDQRVHFALQQLRRWIATHRFPVKIIACAEHYVLTSARPFCIDVPTERTPVTREWVWLEELRRSFPKGTFSLAEASRVLGVSSRTALRALHAEMRSGTVARTGSAAKTRYELNPTEFRD